MRISWLRCLSASSLALLWICIAGCLERSRPCKQHSLEICICGVLIDSLRIEDERLVADSFPKLILNLIDRYRSRSTITATFS